MSNDEPRQNAALNWNAKKDVAVLLPLFGTSLAIAWEVGRFSPTGGFNLFGLADHIVAATAALPVALTMGATYPMLFLLVAALSDKLTTATGRQGLVLALSLLTPFVVVILSTRGPQWKAIDGSDLVAFGAIALIVINQIWLHYPLTGPIGIGLYFVVAVLTSLTLSSELVKKEMARADEGKGVATVTTKADYLQGARPMAGDRGLLTYRPDTKQVSNTMV